MSLIFLALGIWLIYYANKTKSQSATDLANSLKTVGKVIDIETSWGQKSRSYSPKIAFKTNQNQIIVFVSPHSSSFNPYRIGHQVEVYYNPQNPNRAGIVGDSNGQLGSVFSTIIGIFIAIFGAGLAVVELLVYATLIYLKFNLK